MAIRDEPEYIDDDEYFDPDDYSAKGRARRNVLGASGTRRGGDSASDPPNSSPDHEASFAAPEQSRREPHRRSKKQGKQSNPAAASSPKSLRGHKHEPRLTGKAANPKHADSATAPEAGKRRFPKLRGRFRRGNTQNSAKKSAAPVSIEQRPSRFAVVARGFGKLSERIRPGNPANDNEKPRSVAKSGKPADSRDTRQSIRAAFGASRGETRGARPDLPSTQSSRNAPGKKTVSKKSDEQGKKSKAPIFKSNDWLDLDRKLDLIGVGLVFGAIVLFFSALSREQAAISAINNLIGQLLGWGALAVPLAMFAIGMWLIIRHFGDQAPTVDPIRLAGVALAFLGILILFQFLESFSYAQFIATVGRCQEDCVRVLAQNSYQSGRGGGFVGAWFYLALVNNLTEVGGFIIALMLLTFAAMMTTRMSMAEITVVAIGFARGVRGKMAQQAAARRSRRLQAEQQMALANQEAHLHVSKPAPAKLPGSVQATPALPEPSGETMPIPTRLRGLISRRFGQGTEDEFEKVELASGLSNNLQASGSGIFGRLFNRGNGDEAALPVADRPTPMTAAAMKPAARPTRPVSRPATTESSWRVIPRPQFNPDWRAQPSRSEPPEPPPAQGNGSPPPAVAPGQDRETIAQSPDLTASVPSEESPEINQTLDDKAPTAASEKTSEPVQASPDLAQAIDPESSPAAEDSPQPIKAVDDEEELPDQVMIEAAKRYGPPADDEMPESAPDAVAEPVSTGPVNQSRSLVSWQLPDYRELLSGGSTGEMDEEVLLHHAQIIEDTLASFGAPGRVVELNTGPVITQFGVEPDYLTSRAGKRNRVKVSAIAQLDKDLQLALGAKSIRVEAPVPGKGYVGIEVPNPESAMVSLRDVMESRGFQRIDSPLAIALGKSVDGAPISADLSQMPHLLIAGTTGSGKSKCINAIIISMLANCTPDEVKFIMVDPKRVELTGYNGLPHLVSPVVVELERIVGVLRWVTREMDARYKKFSRAGARNIIDYNSILEPTDPPMPYIVVIIDELADLMMMAPDETERSISRIAALARATGIHLVIATQRPSVDVVTGLIKANFPARIAFAVAGSVDSRVILDQPGAERLLGKGDMLYLSGDAPAPLRMQGVFVSDEEINVINRFWKMQNYGLEAVKPIDMPAVPLGKRPVATGNQDASAEESPGQHAFWDMSSQRDMSGMAVEGKTGNPDPQEDELYQTAVDMVRRLDKASISLLQRRLRIGYTRAARLVDMMEERGVVGPPKEGSSKPRDVLPEK